MVLWPRWSDLRRDSGSKSWDAETPESWDAETPVLRLCVRERGAGTPYSRGLCGCQRLGTGTPVGLRGYGKFGTEVEVAVRFIEVPGVRGVRVQGP